MCTLGAYGGRDSIPIDNNLLLPTIITVARAYRLPGHVVGSGKIHIQAKIHVVEILNTHSAVQIQCRSCTY